MTTFFIDLWHDLREKRLWPVAVGLLAAIVAVPAILFKPASDATPDTAVAPRTTSAQTLPVVTVDSGPTQGSKLEAFEQKNPFKPMKDLAKEDTTPGTAGSTSADSGSGDGSGGGSFGTDPASTGGSGGSDGSSTPGGGSSSGGSSPAAPGIDPNGPRVQWFRRAADFSFGPTGSPKKFEGPNNFTMLPDEQSPSIVFLGVADDGKRAMFMVADPGFEAAGEGSCTPKRGPCQFVALKVGDSDDEETFTSIDGKTSYELKLLDIRREKLSTDADGNPQPANAKTVAGESDDDSASAAEAGRATGPGLMAAGPGFARERR